MLRCAAVGMLTGLVAVAFRRGLDWAEGMRLEAYAAMHEHGAWLLVPFCVTVFLIGWALGWVVRHHAPECAGSGIPHVETVLQDRATMRWRRVLVVKFFGGIAAIGSGLSLGREGPTVQMGAAIAQAIGGWRRLPAESMRSLIACGAGAGLAAAFNAPLAGLAFVFEELRRGLHGRSLLGTMVGTVCAVLVTMGLLGTAPILEVVASVHGGVSVAGVLAGMAIGAIAGLGGALFNVSIVSANAARLRLPARWAALLPGFACVFIAIIGWFQIDATGDGLGVTNVAMHWSGRAWSAVALLLVVKFVATIIAYGSGAPGGIFAPLLLLGGLVGVLIGRALAAGFPSMAFDEPTIAMLGLFGMAAFFTASVRAPLTGVLLIIEMSRDASNVLGLAVASMTAFIVADAVGSRPVYEALSVDACAECR